MRSYLTYALLALSLSGCNAITALVNPVAPADVAALEEATTIAETLALNYTRLPPCPSTALCSDLMTKQNIKLYGQKAHDAVKALQASSASGAPAAYATAQAALTAFQASIPPVTKTN